MGSVLSALDSEWERLGLATSSRRRVAEWGQRHAALCGCVDLMSVLERRRQPEQAGPVLRALAELAGDDDLAARTLLQALLPGVVSLGASIGGGGEVMDDLVALAWERIRTYPLVRGGSVAANVLLDVRKRYWREYPHSCGEVQVSTDLPDEGCSVEAEVVNRLSVAEVVDARSRGRVTESDLVNIIRTRALGESVAEVAAEAGVPPRVLCHPGSAVDGHMSGVADANVLVRGLRVF